MRLSLFLYSFLIISSSSSIFLFILGIFIFVCKIFKKKIDEKKPRKDKLKKIKIKPFFKEKIVLANNYKYYDYDFFGFNLEVPAKLSTYDIYKLKNINDSFYLAFLNEKIVKIIKYNLVNKTTTEKAIINFFPMKIKYFYDQIQNKEYLFILTEKKGLKIFLIKNDIQYEEEIYKGLISRRYRCFHDFEIIYDKYNKNNCLITSLTFREVDGCRNGRDICIFKFAMNEFVQINKYKVYEWSSLNRKRQKLLLIWENKFAKNFFLITSHYTKLKFMKISSTTNEYISDFDIINSEDFYNNKFNFFGCIIYNRNYTDYLYISNDLDALIIIDLYKKEIISEIKIMKDLTSIINLNNKYIILSTKKSIYTFDANINQIINKYVINTNGEIISVKKINIDKVYQFHISLDNIDGKIIIM